MKFKSRPIGKYKKTTLLTLLLIKIDNYINLITQDSQESWKATGCSQYLQIWHLYPQWCWHATLSVSAVHTM